MPRRGTGLYKRGTVWYLDFRHNGRRHVIRIGRHINRTVATEIAQVKRAAIVRNEAGIRDQRKDLLFKDARAKFERWTEANKKPNTIVTYKECLRRLGESFNGKRLSEITPFVVEQYKQRRLQEGAKVRVNRELAVLKALYNRCIDWMLFEGTNPVQRVKFLKEPRQRLRYLEPDEEQRLLSASPEPLRTIILVGIHCGLRLQSEALTLRWTDVDLARKTLTVQAGYAKSGQTRTVPLNSVVHAALSRLKAHAKSNFVFEKRDGTPYDSIRNGFQSACTRAGLKGVTPHTTRHTFATRLIANGVDLRTVQELGGWASLRMLERYAHVAPTRKAQAVEELVESFHNAFHNTDQPHTGGTFITQRKNRRGEVAEWPKATVC